MHYSKGDYDLFTYMKNPEVFQVRDGMIDLLTGPGLGVELNEDLIRKQAEESKDFHWRNDTWRGPDGGIREW
jgi:galactonate dehydratase